MLFSVKSINHVITILTAVNCDLNVSAIKQQGNKKLYISWRKNNAALPEHRDRHLPFWNRNVCLHRWRPYRMNKHVFKEVKIQGCCFADNGPLNLLSIKKWGRQMPFLICERQRLTFARSVKCMECKKHMGCEVYGLTDRCLLYLKWKLHLKGLWKQEQLFWWKVWTFAHGSNFKMSLTVSLAILFYAI